MFTFVLALAGSLALQAGAQPARPAEPPVTACCTATIRVRVPEGTGTVYLAGSLPQLGSWRPDGLALGGQGRERTARITAPSGTSVEYKFTLGSWDREAVGPDGTAPPNSRLLLTRDTVIVHRIPGFKRDPKDYIADWRGSGVLGRLVYWTDVKSAFLGPTRNVEIWLPPGYDSATATRYPVLYMSDGQNLFDPRIANTGVDWGVDEAVVRLVRRGVIPPIVVVGVWNSADRGAEYSPWHRAPEYARFLIEELMPRVNREFRTLTGPANTAAMGSSLGGLLSFYLVLHHPDVFGACGCISTSFQLSEALVARYFPGLATAAAPDTTPYVVRDIRAGNAGSRGHPLLVRLRQPGECGGLRATPRRGAGVAARAGLRRGSGFRDPALSRGPAQRGLMARTPRRPDDIPVRAETAVTTDFIDAPAQGPRGHQSV